jgi:hypothetical protein
MAKIRLKDKLTSIQEQWLIQNIGPRMHYLHNSIGGQGWRVKKVWEADKFRENNTASLRWYLTIDNDKLASFFALKFL